MSNCPGQLSHNLPCSHLELHLSLELPPLSVIIVIILVHIIVTILVHLVFFSILIVHNIIATILVHTITELV